MKRETKVKTMVKAAALSAALISTTAFAAPIFYTVDNFNTGAQRLSDNTADGIAEVQAIAQRTLSIDLQSAVPPASSTAEIFISAGQGHLDIINGGGDRSEVKINWNLAPGLLPTSATSSRFYLQVLESDSNPTNASFFLNGALLSANSIAGNTLNQSISFGLSAAQVIAVNAGGSLELRINGTAGWDFSADSIGFSYEPAVISTVPVPGTLALFALGLAGLTFRKKKQA
jgi:PEP-CTERM motif